MAYEPTQQLLQISKRSVVEFAHCSRNSLKHLEEPWLRNAGINAAFALLSKALSITPNV